MSETPYISICIPAYKNIDYLKRLFDSIFSQTFTGYEIIVSDDSPDQSVFDFVKSYPSTNPILYFRNSPPLGTPENWNQSIRMANGVWIKLMHDDDWFRDKHALQRFYEETQRHPECSFFFSAFCNITEETGVEQVVTCNWFDKFVLWLSPLHLFRRVYIGNPSCTLIKRDIGLFYDRDFKFVVDFEYYIRCIDKLKKYHYINCVLLNIGFNKEQVTKYTFLVPEVQLPENLILLKKYGNGILRNILVYDYYWRMFRNLNIRHTSDIANYYNGNVPVKINFMLAFQRRIPKHLLNMGVVSKLCMFISYMFSVFMIGNALPAK